MIVLKKKLMILISAILLLIAITVSILLLTKNNTVVSENGLFNYDPETKTITLLKSKEYTYDEYDFKKYADKAEHFYIPNANVGYKAWEQVSVGLPHLKTLSGEWHYDDSDRLVEYEDYGQGYDISLTNNDPVAFWEIDLEKRTLTIDARKNPFKGRGFFKNYNHQTGYGNYSNIIEYWREYKDYIDTLVLGDGITWWTYQAYDSDVMADLSIDKVVLGKNVEYFSGLLYLAEKEYEVHPENPHFSAYNGALYTKDYKTLKAFPFKNTGVELHPDIENFDYRVAAENYEGNLWKLDFPSKTLTYIGEGEWTSPYGYDRMIAHYDSGVEKIVISDGITSFEPSGGLPCFNPDYIYIGKDLESYIPRDVPKIAFEVSPENPYLTVKNGALYSKKDGDLICSPEDRGTKENGENNLVYFEEDKEHGVCWTINFDTGLLHVMGSGNLEENYFIYDSHFTAFNVEKIKKVVVDESVNDIRFTGCFACAFPKLETLRINSKNGCYSEYTKENKTMTLCGNGEFEDSRIDEIRTVENLVISDGITVIPYINMWYNKVYIGKDLKLNTILPNTDEYEVSENSKNFSHYKGALYSKDYKKLIKCKLEWEMDENSIEFHPNLQIIGEDAFFSFAESGTLVIPWGIRKIEGEVNFWMRDSYMDVVLPDTLMDFEGKISGTQGGIVFLSGNNEKQVEAYLPQQRYYEYGGEYFDYYGIKKNSFKTFDNGKTYYFDENRKMATGKKQIGGKWYHFNEYGELQ